VTDTSRKRRELSLGAYDAVTLAQVRDTARKMRGEVAQGKTLQSRREVAAAAEAARPKPAPKVRSFDEASAAYIAAHRAGWKSAKLAEQWENTLSAYASPAIGHLPVAEITTAHVLAILSPIWSSKHETATRVRSRLELVLDAENALGHRTGENPAARRGNLKTLLPKVVPEKKNHRAMPLTMHPAFMSRLRETRSSLSAQALEFTILTAVRSGEVRGMTWGEVDLDAALWSIPAGRMKAGDAHTVPLSADALAQFT